VSDVDGADKGVERKSKRKTLLGLLKGSWKRKEKRDEVLAVALWLWTS